MMKKHKWPMTDEEQMNDRGYRSIGKANVQYLLQSDSTQHDNGRTNDINILKNELIYSE